MKSTLIFNVIEFRGFLSRAHAFNKTFTETAYCYESREQSERDIYR